MWSNKLFMHSHGTAINFLCFSFYPANNNILQEYCQCEGLLVYFNTQTSYNRELLGNYTSNILKGKYSLKAYFQVCHISKAQ